MPRARRHQSRRSSRPAAYHSDYDGGGHDGHDGHDGQQELHSAPPPPRSHSGGVVEDLVVLIVLAAIGYAIYHFALKDSDAMPWVVVGPGGKAAESTDAPTIAGKAMAAGWWVLIVIVSILALLVLIKIAFPKVYKRMFNAFEGLVSKLRMKKGAKAKSTKDKVLHGVGGALLAVQDGTVTVVDNIAAPIQSMAKPLRGAVRSAMEATGKFAQGVKDRMSSRRTGSDDNEV